jgi:membrane protease YdiL (CAAX protease family)
MANYLFPKRGEKESWDRLFISFLAVVGMWIGIGGIATVVFLALFGNIKTAWSEYLIGLIAFVPFFLGLYLHTLIIKRPFRSLITPRAKLDVSHIVLGAVTWLLIVSSFALLGKLIDPESMSYTFDLQIFLPAVLILVFLLPIQTTAEELFFRGFLSQTLSKVMKNPIVINVIASLIFASLHLANPEVKDDYVSALLVYGSIGFAWGFAAYLFGSLEIAIGAHLANNAFGLLIVGYENSALPSSAIFTAPAAELSGSVVGSLLMMSIWLLLVLGLRRLLGIQNSLT